MHRNSRKLVPFFILVILILIVYLTNVHDHLTLENLRREEGRLKSYIEGHPILSPLIYMGIYIVSVILIIPDSIILTLLAGLVFPLPLAIIYAIFSEVVGAIIFFAIFNGAFGKAYIQRERPFLHKMRKEFHRHASIYLLFVRISHVVPFWLTNISAAYFRVNYWTFIWTCFVGVIPLTYFLADAGHSLSQVFAKDQDLTLSAIFTFQLKVSLILLSLIAFIPLIYKKFIRKRRWKL